MPLSKQPLVLVLAQVRFTPVRQMAEYIPGIQENFRRQGYPIEKAGKVQQLQITPAGAQVIAQQRWEYRKKDESWNILVFDDSLVLQTTAYRTFEAFADELERALRTVLTKTDSDELGLIQRVGLRYVDLIQPRAGEGYRYYLRPGFHGVDDAAFKPQTHRVNVESSGRTKVGDTEGTMVIRVFQTDNGFDLPPDLVGAAPKRTPRTSQGELVTFVDMDHFSEGNFEASAEWVIARAYEMHDHLIETFHEHVVTPQAIEVWR